MTTLHYTSETCYELSKSHPTDAGIDITSAENVSIPARGRSSIHTGIELELPQGTYAEIGSRSGLFFRHGIEAFSGVIDADYRGEVIIGLKNLSDYRYDITKGDRIAQLLIHPVMDVQITEVDQLVTSTSRGTAGFGSTGH